GITNQQREVIMTGLTVRHQQQRLRLLHNLRLYGTIIFSHEKELLRTLTRQLMMVMLSMAWI
ncbi:hypothetical protein Pmar_PMAR015789, partial [Perkinsus marinus ATCC 50983]